MMKAWKAFRLDKNNNLLFLFHGLHGSRKVPTNTWILAERKWVQDGEKSQQYMSGFHIFLHESEIEKWKKRTKLPSVVLPVEAKMISEKWSNPNIGIAKYIRVTYG